jgi:hypothetical protein
MPSNSMNLILPTPSVTPGPTYATQLNTALTAVAEHDHSSGNGVKVTPAGMNIISDLSMQGSNLTVARSLRMQNQSGVLIESADIGCLYIVNGDLYYQNIAGTAIQVTSGGGINIASTGTIGGDYGQPGVTAAVNYSDTNKVFAFTQDTGEAAEIFSGTINIADAGSGSLSVGITANSATASYDIILPLAAPTGDDQVFAISSAGQASFRDIDGTTGQITVTKSATAFTVSLPATITSSQTFSGTNTFSGATTLSSTTTLSGTATVSGACTFSNTTTFSGATTGRGIVPLGAVLPTFPALSGAYACVATTAADSNGYVLCNGQTISDGTSTMNGVVIPNINNDVFLKGNTTSNTSGGANTVTLTSTELPAHTHTGPSHTHTIDHGHSNTFALGGTTSFATTSHTHGTSTLYASIELSGSTLYGRDAFSGSWTSTEQFTSLSPAYSSIARSFGTPINGSTDTPSATGTVSFSGAVTSMTGSSGSSGTAATGSTGSGSAFSIQPKYITAVYVMRIK